MRRVELVPGIQSSVIGFGCAPILGAVGAQEAERAINAALDAGINHFDLARSYGFGKAEAMVGRALRGKRDQVVLATKFGIEATAAATLLSPLKPLVRAFRPRRSTAARLASPSVTIPVRSSNLVGSLFHKRIVLEPATMRRSLEASLRALETDWVDYFFVHEPLVSVGRIDDLIATAGLMKQEGKIRAWGLAFNYASRLFHSSYLSCFDLLQFDCSPTAPHYYTAFAERTGRPNILFSPFRSGYDAGEPLNPALILQRLAADFPRSVILCSMFRESHIRANAAAVVGA